MISNNYSLDLKSRVINEYNKKIKNIKEISSDFSVSKSSVYNWIQLYKNDDLTVKKAYTKPTSKFHNSEIRVIISDFIGSNPNFIYTCLIATIKEKTHIKISKSTLYDILSDLKFSKKVSKFKKIYGSQDKLDIKTNILKEQIKDIPNDKIISIDEVSFDTNIIHKYGWSLTGVPVVKTIGATYKRLTMICAITNKKVLHYKIINNSAHADTFWIF